MNNQPTDQPTSNNNKCNRPPSTWRFTGTSCNNVAVPSNLNTKIINVLRNSSVWWWADARQIHIINIARLSHANVNPLFLRQVNQKWSHSNERFCIVNKSWAIRCPFRSIKFDNEIIDYYRFNTINEMCICDQCYVYGTKTFFLIANILWCITLSRYLFIRV